MKPRDAQFLELYETARVRDFMAFYAFRLKDFKAAQRELAYLVGAIYIGSAIAGAFAAINVLGHRVLWAVIGAALPVTTTAVKRFGKLYSYRELSQVYSETADELLKASATRPVTKHVAESWSETEIREYVLRVEAALRREQIRAAQVESTVDLTGS